MFKKGKVRQKTTDLGYLTFAKEVDELGKLGATVGIHENAGHYPDGTKVTDVAAWNEFGTDQIPPRPFVRRTIEANTDQLKEIKETAYARLLTGKVTALEAYKSIGFKVAALMKRMILRSSEWAEPNAPSTLARKKGTVPLVNSRLLYRAVDYEVTKK